MNDWSFDQPLPRQSVNPYFTVLSLCKKEYLQTPDPRLWQPERPTQTLMFRQYLSLLGQKTGTYQTRERSGLMIWMGGIYILHIAQIIKTYFMFQYQKFQCIFPEFLELQICCSNLFIVTVPFPVNHLSMVYQILIIVFHNDNINLYRMSRSNVACPFFNCNKDRFHTWIV